jgi:hypothetical protein
MSTQVLERAARTAGGPARPLVEVVVPVHNEERALEASIWRLHGYLTAPFPFAFRITVADNASTDATWPLARKLAEQLLRVHGVHLDQKGRGRALRHVWSGRASRPPPSAAPPWTTSPVRRRRETPP